MERDGAPESSRDVGDAGDSLPEEWRVLDEWSEHSKDEELEEGEIVDSDTDGDTRNPRNVRPSEVPSGIGVVNQGPWTVVEDICRKTTRSLLKMAETTAFSGSEDGEIVEAENSLNCEQSSYKITSRNSVGSAAVSCLVGGATGTVSSSGFCVGSGHEQLPARPDSGNQGLSSKGKVDGHKTFAKNQMDSTVDGNDDLVINTTRGDVQPIESAAQTKVSADKFTDTTPETFDIQTTLVENGAVALSPTAYDEGSVTHLSSPTTHQETEPQCCSTSSSLDFEFDTNTNQRIVADNELAVDETTDNDNVTVLNKDLNNGNDDETMTEEDKELAVESTECLLQHIASIDMEPVSQANLGVDSDEVVVPADVTSLNLTSVTLTAAEASTDVVTSTKTPSDKSTVDDNDSDVQNLGSEMESTATHLENSEDTPEESPGPNKMAPSSTLDKELTDGVSDATKQQGTSSTFSTSDIEFDTSIKEKAVEDNVATDGAALLVKNTNLTTGNKGLIDVNEELITAFGELVEENKKLAVDTRETVSSQEESLDTDPITQANQATDTNILTYIVTPAASASSVETQLPITSILTSSTMSSSAMMSSTVTTAAVTSPADTFTAAVTSLTNASASEVDVTSSSMTTLVQTSPVDVEVLVLPSTDTSKDIVQCNGSNHGINPTKEGGIFGQANEVHTETGRAANDATEDHDGDVITATVSPDTTGKQRNTEQVITVAMEQDDGIVVEVGADNQLLVPPEEQSQTPVSPRSTASSQGNTGVPSETLTSPRLPAAAGPELLRRLTILDSRNASPKSSKQLCDFCLAAFEDVSQLILHINTHEKVCCASMVASTFEYSHHMYQCVACCFSTRSRQVFREHIRSHIVKFPYWCGKCHATVKSIDALLKHSQTAHPDAAYHLIPRYCSTLEQILRKLGPAAPSTVTRLQSTDGKAVVSAAQNATILPHGRHPSAKKHSETKEQHPDAEQIIVLDDVDEEEENQKDGSTDSLSPCHLKIASVVSLSDSAKAIENFSRKDDLAHCSTAKDDVVLIPGTSSSPTKLSKSSVILECLFSNGFYQCKRCNYKTPDRREFRRHVVQEVHQKSKICLDCFTVPMATLLSEAHHCTVVEKVMAVMRRQVASSGGVVNDPATSVARQSHPDTTHSVRESTTRCSPGVPSEGYILHIPDGSDSLQASVLGGKAGAVSGVRSISAVSARAYSPVRVTPFILNHGPRTSIASEAPKASTPATVHKTLTVQPVLSNGSVHHVIHVPNPEEVPTKPTPVTISPIVIQPINAGQLAGMPATSGYPPAVTTALRYGMANGTTFSTVCDGEMPHLTGSPVQWNTPTTTSVENQVTSVSLEASPSDNIEHNVEGCTWSNQPPVASFSAGSAGLTSSDTRGGLDSSFTEAFSMLEELGNAQAGLCALSHPQSNSSGDMTVGSVLHNSSDQSQDSVTDLASGDVSKTTTQGGVIVVPDTPTELSPGVDVVVCDAVTQPQPQRMEVVCPDLRGSARLANMQQAARLHKSATPERQTEPERTDEDRFSYYRCGFPSCSFLGDSETGFCNHYYDCHRDVYIYRCAFCTLMFRYPPQLCEHLRQCHHAARYRCLSCREPFQTQRQLIVHMIQTHRLSTSIRCASPRGCTVASNSLSQFRMHYENSHAAESCFTCSCCAMEFSTMALLLRHIEKSVNRFVSCPVCKRMSTTVACKKLLHHIITEHPQAPRTIVKMNFINCWEKLSLGSSLGGTGTTAMQIFMPEVLTASKGNVNQGQSAVGNSVQGSRENSPVTQHPREVFSAPSAGKTVKLKQTARKTQTVVPHSVLRNELLRSTVDEPETMLTCDCCNFACTIAVLLDQHRRLHDRLVVVPEGTLFKCPRCPFFGNSITEFHTHTRYHLSPQTVLRYFRCTRCRYATNDMNLVEEHMEKKHPDASCNYKVSREVLTHPNATVLCQHCGMTCLGEASLTKHVRLRHGDSLKEQQSSGEKSRKRTSPDTPMQESPQMSIEKYHCDFCEFDTNSLALLKQHHSNEHVNKTAKTSPAVVVKLEPVESLPDLEPDAGAVVGRDSSLGSRSQTLLMCDLCPYNTHVLHHMERHKKGHEEQKQITEGFRCGYCTYVSAQKSTMTRHVRRYHAAEPMNLKRVSGGVVTALPPTMDLTNGDQSSGGEMRNAVIVGTVKQVHPTAPRDQSQCLNELAGSESSVMSISDGEDTPDQEVTSQREYSCDICSYTTDNRSHYDRHQRNHLNTCEDGYRCTYCGYTSVMKGPVTKHVAMQHAGLPLKITHFLSNSSKKSRLSKATSNKKPLDASAEQETTNVSGPRLDESSTTSIDKTDVVAMVPGGLAAFEMTLPKEMIFKTAVECPLCDYSTKVHYNMVRHLQGHCDRANKIVDAQGEQANMPNSAGHVTHDTSSNDGMRRSMSSEVLLSEAGEESDKPAEVEKLQTDTASCDDSSSEEEDSEYVISEGDEASKGARVSPEYCTRVQNMDLYRCTKCVFMHRFPSKVRRHYFYKHAKCYPYKCGHCTFEAVESGKIKRHCILMHDLLPIKVIKRQVDTTTDTVTPTLSEGIVMSDVRHGNVDIITDDDFTAADDTDSWLGAYITKMNNENRQQCRICGYIQLGASSVKRHVLAVHLKFYPYSCRYCSYSQVELNKVKKHIEHSHPGRPCTVVKRKLGVPPGEGDENSVQSDDVTEQDGSNVSTQEVSGGHTGDDGQIEDKATGNDGGEQGKRADNTTGKNSVGPNSGEVIEEPVNSTSGTHSVERDSSKVAQPPIDGATAAGLVEPSTGHDAEDHICQSAMMDISGQCPDKVTEETRDDDDDDELTAVDITDQTLRPGTDSRTSGGQELIKNNMSEQIVTAPQGRDEAKEHTAIPVTGHVGIVDHSSSDTVEEETEQHTHDTDDLTTDKVLDHSATESTDVVQRDASNSSDKNDKNETNDHDVYTRRTAESSADISTFTRVESSTDEGGTASENNRNETTSGSIGTPENGDVESVGMNLGSTGHLGEDDKQRKETNVEDKMPPQDSNSNAVLSRSDKLDDQSSNGNSEGPLVDSQQREGNDSMLSAERNTIEDREQCRSQELRPAPSKQPRDANNLSNGEKEDNDVCGAETEESADVEAVGEDIDTMEDAGHVLCGDDTPCPQGATLQVKQVQGISADKVAEETAGSPLPQLRRVKQEALDIVNGHSKNREEPILSVFANELAETAIKQEHLTSHEADMKCSSLNTSQEADSKEGTRPTSVKHVPLASLLKQRKVFLCVYCDYRSMYSPSDVRKHIFAVHMRRYPYRCGYCAFQNMKKFAVQKHTKKSHSSRPIVVNEAPVFRNNITVLESQGNKVSVGVVGADGIPVMDVELLSPLLHQLDDSPTKDIPGKKWTRKVSVPAPALRDTSSVPSSETEKEASGGSATVSRWRCTECGMEDEKVNRVQVHVLTRHLKLRPYQCPYCPWGTWKTTPVEEHIRLKHPSEMLKVLENVCEKLADIKKFIKEILASETVSPPLTVSSAAKVVMSIPSIEGTNLLPTMHCDLCPYTASSQSRLQKHRKTHFCYRPFGCFYCTYTSFSRFKVRCHSSRVHKNKQVIVKTLKTPDMTDPRNSKVPQSSPYKCVGAGVQVCGHCPYTASTSEKLDSHMKREHPELMSYKCGHCGIYLTSKEHMAEHVVERHGVSSRSADDNNSKVPLMKRLKMDDHKRNSGVFVKSEPGKDTPTTSNKRSIGNSTGGATTIPSKKLKLSNLLSTPKSAGLESKGSSSPVTAGYLFRCKHCNFTSTLSLVMRHHAMAHLHYRPFFCPLCETVRAVKSYPIKKHIAVYHQGGQVQCALKRDTEMEYKVQASYTRETLTGTMLSRCEKIGSDPPLEDKDVPFVYKCDLCSYTSPSHKFMQHHVMAHLNYRPYRCPYCMTNRSVRSYPVKKHIRSMHRGRKSEIIYSRDVALEAKLAASFHKQHLNSSQMALLMSSSQKKRQTLASTSNDQKKASVIGVVSMSSGQEKTQLSTMISTQSPEKKPQTAASQGSSTQQDVISVGSGHHGSDKRPKTAIGHSTYVCKWCGYMAATPSLVRLHAMVHFGYRPFSCPHCTTMKSVRSYPIKKHIRAMHPGKPMEVILKTDPAIEAKVNQSTVQQLIPSKELFGLDSKDDGKKVQLEQRTNDKSADVVKKEGHLGKKKKYLGKFVCNTCSYSSPKWTLMRRHVMVHFGYRPYHCPYCQSMRSVRGSPIRMHIRAVHPGKATNVVFRPDLAVDAKVLSGFTRPAKHVGNTRSALTLGPKKQIDLRVVDNIGDTVSAAPAPAPAPDVTGSPKRVSSVLFRCVNCNFRTKYKADLRFHLMSEMDYRPFGCFYCDHQTVGRCLLRKHQRKHHTGKFAVSMHRKPECEARLIELMDKSVLKGVPVQHQAHRGTEPPVIVKVEPDTDTNNKDGLAPMRAPGNVTGEGKPRKNYKRYDCIECSYSCSKKKLLLKHCGARHDPKKYGCGYCNCKEFYPSLVRRHCRRHHKGLPPKCIILTSGEQYPINPADDREKVLTTKSPSAAAAVKAKEEVPSSDKLPVLEDRPPDNVTELFNQSLGKYECYLCLYSNSNVTLFKKHISVHYPARWQCGHCALKFRQMDRLRRHSRLAHPSLPINCANDASETAVKVSQSPSTIKRDMSPQGKPLSVPKLKVTARKSIHKIVPSVSKSPQAKPLSVPRKKLTARKSINRFVPTLNETVLRFFCGLCPYAATNEAALSKHMMVAHSSGNAVLLKCGFCSFSAFDDASFIEHARSHTFGNASTHSDKPQAPKIDPNSKEMQPDVKLVDLLHLSQEELENLLVQNDIGGIYF